MAIDLFGSLKYISDKLFAGFLGTAFESSFWISLIITVLIVLCVIIMYPAKSGTKISSVWKLFIYSFLGTFAIILLHDSAIRYKAKKEYTNTELDAFANDIFAQKAQPVPQPMQQTQPMPQAQPAPQPAPQPVVQGSAETGLPFIAPAKTGGNPFEK